jgi:hypothetical protein
MRAWLASILRHALRFMSLRTKPAFAVRSQLPSGRDGCPQLDYPVSVDGDA